MQKNFGLALCGGGARGLAHIGILAALEENSLRPQFVAGTSIGAVIGALYCLEASAQFVKDKATEMLHSNEFKRLGLDNFYVDAPNIFGRFKKELFEKMFIGELFFKQAHLKNEVTRRLFTNLFKNKTFDDLKIGFACNALDVQSGAEVVFSSGSIIDAVWASCAIPGIFPPFIKNDRIFVDGGVSNNIPIEPVKSIGAKVVLAIAFGEKPKFEGYPDTGLLINQRALSFMKYHLDQRILSHADLVINPGVGQFHWADFSPVEMLINKGHEAITSNIKKIKAILSFWYRMKKRLQPKNVA